ncbi:hypothetical protein ACLOJK_019875 [Asimina triloba]
MGLGLWNGGSCGLASCVVGAEGAAGAGAVEANEGQGCRIGICCEGMMGAWDEAAAGSAGARGGGSLPADKRHRCW